MRQAARAIIIENNKILLMQRNKNGNEYYTLVGGGVKQGETQEEAVKREVKEETGLDVTSTQLAFIEELPEPYHEQYTFICTVAPHGEVELHPDSEEATMNKFGLNIHTPVWIDLNVFEKIPFRSIHLQEKIGEAIKQGFPKEPIKIYN